MFARLASGVSFGLYNTNIQGDRANDEYLSNLTFSPTLLGLERSLNPEVIFLVLRYVSDPSNLVEKWHYVSSDNIFSIINLSITVTSSML